VTRGARQRVAPRLGRAPWARRALIGSLPGPPIPSPGSRIQACRTFRGRAPRHTGLPLAKAPCGTDRSDNVLPVGDYGPRARGRPLVQVNAKASGVWRLARSSPRATKREPIHRRWRYDYISGFHRKLLLSILLATLVSLLPSETESVIELASAMAAAPYELVMEDMLRGRDFAAQLQGLLRDSPKAGLIVDQILHAFSRAIGAAEDGCKVQSDDTCASGGGKRKAAAGGGGRASRRR
jgi:hypothetical protein